MTETHLVVFEARKLTDLFDTSVVGFVVRGESPSKYIDEIKGI